MARTSVENPRVRVTRAGQALQSRLARRSVQKENGSSAQASKPKPAQEEGPPDWARNIAQTQKPQTAKAAPPAAPSSRAKPAPDPESETSLKAMRFKSRAHYAAPPAPPERERAAWLSEALARGEREPFAMVADIAPDDARWLLSANPENRAIKVTQLNRLKRDMAAGHWRFNGESIVVAVTGELNDGQHRLQASMETGLTLRTVIAFGVPRDSRETLDIGLRRDLADFLSFRGVKYPTAVAGVGRLVGAFERSKGAHFRALQDFSATELIDRVVSDSVLQSATAYGISRYTASEHLMPPTAIGACRYILGRVDEIEAEEFLDRVLIGDRLARDSAAFETRRQLMMTTTKARAQLCSLVLWGWWLHRRKLPPRQLQIRFPLPDITEKRGE